MNLRTPAVLGVLVSVVTVLFACSGGSNGYALGGDGGSPDGKAPSRGPSGGPANVSSRAEQENNGCPTSPTVLQGTGGAGKACSTYADCLPSCCDCASGSRSYLAAACIDGKCGDKPDTCYRAKSSTMCPGESIDPSDPEAPDAESPVPRPEGQTLCVNGYSSDCDDPGEHWTGSQCCVDHVTQCVNGYSSDCDDPGEHWTGSQCCVEASPLCVSGYSSDCDDPGEHWTGAQCCVEGASLCVDGYSSDCDDSGEQWTGSKCCIAKSNVICEDGYSSDCDDPGEYWTGSQCCVENVTQCIDGFSSDCDDPGEHWTGSKCCL